MIANQFLDIYTSIVSWKMYGILWDTLNGTGLAYIPFIVAIISSLRQAYDQSASRIIATLEMQMLGFIIMLILVVIPYQNNAVSIEDVKYTITSTSCNVADVSGMGDATGKSADDVFSDLGGAGASIRVPVAWGLVDYLSSSITYTAIKAIGCAASYDEVLYKISTASIDDTQVLDRLEAFNNQCYRPALADLQQNGLPAGMTRDQLEAWEDPAYIGSEMLLNTPGRYFQSPQAYVHHAEEYGFDYSPTPGSLDEQHDEDMFGATVTCKELWEGRDDVQGLRDVVFESVTDTDDGEDAWDDWDEYGSELYGTLTEEEQKESFLKAVLDANAGNYAAVDEISVGSEQVETSWTDPQTYLDGLTNLVAGGLAAWDGASTWAQFVVIKNAMKTAVPMLISMAQALVIIIAPMAMVWTCYSFSTFVTLALAYFGLEFLNAIMGLGYYFENKISLMSNKALADGEVFASLTVYLVSFIQLFLLPTIWLTLVAATASQAVRGMQGVGGSARGTYGSGGSQTATSMLGRGAASGMDRASSRLSGALPGLGARAGSAVRSMRGR
ncbi:conjugal transfer protein TraG N-terminal domain-containing protein [Marinobacterium lutimaris]|uniref:TraG-like protein, N-terminal region n=1 Tax=Marinobacterium lutimaris TaxID=568106 RepID=A0A1H6DWZ5_9GAMM|nr:conjugal transfer protein TraG N-terminal domain-containing protein [Marinobacterium lutimaris]SEG89233.1 TraG-like protein, N-terminal region [Marinobacterium lutimaris]